MFTAQNTRSLHCLRNFSTAFINGIVGTAIKEDNVSKADMQVIAFNLERKPTMALSGIYSIGKTISWATSQHGLKVKQNNE